MRYVFLSLYFIVLLFVEVKIAIYWQTRYRKHVVELAFFLGSVIPPSLYVFYKIYQRSRLCHFVRTVINIFILRQSCEPLVGVSPTIKCRHEASVLSLVKWFLCQLGFILLSAGLGFLAVAIVASKTSAWCCMQQDARARLCDLTIRVCNLFNARGVNYHLTMGSQLGSLRSRDPLQNIEWEHDVDLAVGEEHVEKARKLLLEHGFNIEKGPKGSYLSFRIHLPDANHWMASWAMTWIDVYGFQVDDATKEIISASPQNRNFFRRPLISDVMPYRTTSFCGTTDVVKGPRNPIKYAKGYFGKNFMIPHFPTNYRATTCHFFKDC